MVTVADADATVADEQRTGLYEITGRLRRELAPRREPYRTVHVDARPCCSPRFGHWLVRHGRATDPQWSRDGTLIYFPVCKPEGRGAGCEIYVAKAP